MKFCPTQCQHHRYGKRSLGALRIDNLRTPLCQFFGISYSVSMTYEMVVPELLTRFPQLRSACSVHMSDDEPLPYVALGCVVIPVLEEALALQDRVTVELFCDYFETIAIESKNDSRLAVLLGIEVGEWLPSARNQDILSPRLGPETKRICRYKPNFPSEL